MAGNPIPQAGDWSGMEGVAPPRSLRAERGNPVRRQWIATSPGCRRAPRNDGKKGPSRHHCPVTSVLSLRTTSGAQAGRLRPVMRR